MAAEPIRLETRNRSARMLQTAFGAAIAGWLADAQVVEIMLNPDGRLWVDRLGADLSDSGTRLSAADGEASSASSRIMSAPKFMRAARAYRPNCPTAVSDSRGCCHPW